LHDHFSRVAHDDARGGDAGGAPRRNPMAKFHLNRIAANFV
jgi:hypothetical protein